MKNKIEKFCIFRNKKENTIKYVYNYSHLIYLPKIKCWLIIFNNASNLFNSFDFIHFSDYSFIGEFKGYRIR